MAAESPKVETSATPPVERRAREGQRRALIKVGYSCNDHCVFCHTDDYRHSGDASTHEIASKIDQAWAKGFQMVVFSGGEATMRPDLFRLTRHVRDRGLLLGFITNGRVMSYGHVVRKLLGHNLRYVHLSLHGTERVHNKLTGDRSFAQTFQGLTNLAGRDLDLTANCVVTQQNLGDLRALVDLLIPLPQVTLKFSCCEPKGAALRNAQVVVPSVAQAAAAVVDAVRYGQAEVSRRGATLRFAVENFPFCLMHEIQQLDDDLEANRLLVMSEVWDSGLVDIDDFNKVKPPACAGCEHYQQCPGLFVEYVRAFGDEEVRPQPRSGGQSGTSARGVPVQVVSEDSASGFRPPEQSRIDRHPRHPQTALITLMVPGCEHRCVFCETPQPAAGVRFSSRFGVDAALRAMVGRARGVFFTGGEPTQLDWFEASVKRAKELGYGFVGAQTHGGRFAAPKVAATFAGAGLSLVDIPLYGPDARSHQSVTRTPGSFARACAAISRLKEHGVRVVVHNTLFRSNLGRLPDWFGFVTELGADAAYVQTCADVGPPGTYAQVAPKFEALRCALSRWPADPRFLLSGVPLCVVDSQVAPRLTAATWTGDPDLVLMPYADWLSAFRGAPAQVRAPGCEGCAASYACPGDLPEVWHTLGEQPRPLRLVSPDCGAAACFG